MSQYSNVCSDNSTIYTVIGTLYGKTRKDEDDKVTISYSSEDDAIRAVQLIEYLKYLSYEAIEINERLSKYEDLIPEIKTLGLDPLIKYLFEDERQLGDIDYVRSKNSVLSLQ